MCHRIVERSIRGKFHLVITAITTDLPPLTLTPSYGPNNINLYTGKSIHIIIIIFIYFFFLLLLLFLLLVSGSQSFYVTTLGTAFFSLFLEN